MRGEPCIQIITRPPEEPDPHSDTDADLDVIWRDHNGKIHWRNNPPLPILRYPNSKVKPKSPVASYSQLQDKVRLEDKAFSIEEPERPRVVVEKLCPTVYNPKYLEKLKAKESDKTVVIGKLDKERALDSVIAKRRGKMKADESKDEKLSRVEIEKQKLDMEHLYAHLRFTTIDWDMAGGRGVCRVKGLPCHGRDFGLEIENHLRTEAHLVHDLSLLKPKPSKEQVKRVKREIQNGMNYLESLEESVKENWAKAKAMADADMKEAGY
ncbi:hypothetical protein F53441_1772 [Fusarium austroafricanum]|uniref:Uncharacterized protein n=1 Tax=Fusarium austroafricanum TaxID=2364996 RepID=A0A8H4KSU1_9HYPO|nr:hypothetical protein F53441_1772 [Fusarium austroafricanum]